MFKFNKIYRLLNLKKSIYNDLEVIQNANITRIQVANSIKSTLL